MPVPYTNMEDIIYCHNEEMAKEIFDFLSSKGYKIGLSSSLIKTGTHGEQDVKRLDVFKKQKDSKEESLKLLSRLEGLKSMTVVELAQILEDGLLNSCALNENMSVLEFIETHFALNEPKKKSLELQKEISDRLE